MVLKKSKSADHASKDHILIRGLVIPAEWDETGKVVAVSIAAFNENKYYVSDNPAGKELLSFIEHEVAVVGTLKTAGARMYVTISDFYSFGNRSADVPNE
ncbi:MAG: hypothetical protein AB1427_14490 [Thermodesulfobacteriota bacterium]